MEDKFKILDKLIKLGGVDIRIPTLVFRTLLIMLCMFLLNTTRVHMDTTFEITIYYFFMIWLSIYMIIYPTLIVVGLWRNK